MLMTQDTADILSVRPSFVYSLREKHAINKTIFANMPEDFEIFDTEEDLHFFCPAIFI